MLVYTCDDCKQPITGPRHRLEAIVGGRAQIVGEHLCETCFPKAKDSYKAAGFPVQFTRSDLLNYTREDPD